MSSNNNSSNQSLASQVSPLAFILQNNIKNENGQRLEFKDHYFLIDPYADMNPRQVVMKPSQIGWSVLGINKALWLAKFKQANIIYTLPSKSIVKDFVTPKVDPIIMQNPVYQDMVGKTDSVALKNIGERFVYFRGSWEETAAISISAHILINDEVDRSNQRVLKTYRTRLDAAMLDRQDLGFIWQFSNPSIPGFGVDEMWQQSDQKHWFVKCPHCNFDWYLKFPDNLNFETKTYICAKCKKDLPAEARRVGRWVNKRTSDISGYWISQLMMSWIPAAKIIEDSLGDKQIFNNFTLGLPYISADTSVSRKTITDCLAPGANPQTGVVIGVDNGVVKTVVIGNAFGIFRIYETESWEEVEADIKRYNAYCVIDAMPYPATPIKLAQKYRGRVYIHYFVQDQKDLKIIKWGEGDKQYVVQSDRTKMIDMLVAEFLNKEVIFNLTLTDLEQYIYDWGQLYRTIEESAQGIQKPVWRSIEGRRDHYAFATMYWRIALEKTYTDSGVVTTPLTKRRQPQQGVFISPGRTVPAIDIKKVLERSNKKGKSWKTR